LSAFCRRPKASRTSPPMAPEPLGNVLEQREPVHGRTGADLAEGAHLRHDLLEIQVMRAIVARGADTKDCIRVSVVVSTQTAARDMAAKTNLPRLMMMLLLKRPGCWRNCSGMRQISRSNICREGPTAVTWRKAALGKGDPRHERYLCPRRAQKFLPE
jgi:hypothetical protein